MSIFGRILNNIRIRRRALRLAVPFNTLKGFKIPSKLFVNRKWLDIEYPTNNSMWDVFVEVFLVDGYRLADLRREKIETIIDVGANVGFFSVAARSFFEKAKIVAFEPNPTLRYYLETNLKPINVTLHFEAVGAQNAKINLDFKNDDPLMTTVKEVSDGSINQVAFSDIAKSFSKGIDLLKLDCEGSEWEILEDIESMQKVRFLCMEYHLWAKQGTVEQDVLDMLEKLNFSVIHMVKDHGFGFVMAKNRSY